MVGMAGAASPDRIDLAQDTVQCGWILQLGGQVGMTDHTPVTHSGNSPEGDMTQVAPAGNICMGFHGVQRCASLCIECARAEDHATRCESETC
jgi:hypothetical protein